MATYYIAPGGSNTAAGTNAAPWLTAQKALSVAADGDIIIAKPGLYPQTAAINAVPGVTLRAQNYATLVGGALATHGNNSILDGGNAGRDMVQGTAAGFCIEGFEVRNAGPGGAGMSLPNALGVRVRRNWVHHCARPGIIIREGDLTLIEDNHVNNCATQAGTTGACSGIVVLRPVNLVGATPADWNGYRTIIRRNIAHDNVPESGSVSDGEGIIWDGANTDVRDYTGPGLIQDNIVYKNGGPGIRVMEGKDVDVFNNTIWSNMQDKRPARTTTWGCGGHETRSIRNRWRYNIILEDSPDNTTHAFQNNNAHALFGVTAPTTFLNNVMKGPGSNTARTTRANATEYLVGGTPQDASNKLGVNPLFVSPGTGDFSLQVGSPAIGYGPGGDRPNAGAVQPSAPTLPDPLVVGDAPTVTPTGASKSGLPFSYAEGTTSGGSGTVTKAHKMQLQTDTVWTDAGALTGGTGAFPAVTAAQQFRILETTTRGSETVTNPSLSFLLSPADTAPVTPVEPADLAEVKTRLAAVEGVNAAMLIDLTNARARVAALEGFGLADIKAVAENAHASASAASEALSQLQNALAALDAQVVKVGEGQVASLSQFYVVASTGIPT